MQHKVKLKLHFGSGFVSVKNAKYLLVNGKSWQRILYKSVPGFEIWILTEILLSASRSVAGFEHRVSQPDPSPYLPSHIVPLSSSHHSHTVPPFLFLFLLPSPSKQSKGLAPENFSKCTMLKTSFWSEKCDLWLRVWKFMRLVSFWNRAMTYIRMPCKDSEFFLSFWILIYKTLSSNVFSLRFSLRPRHDLIILCLRRAEEITLIESVDVI